MVVDTLKTVPKGNMNTAFLAYTELTFEELYERAITLPLDKFLDSLPKQEERPVWLLAAVEAWEDRISYQTPYREEFDAKPRAARR